MHKVLLSVLFSLILVAAGSSVALALQSGGAMVGDLETGSIVGQPFTSLDVDLEYTALMIGGKKVWYPGTAILDLRNQGTGGRRGQPVLIKVTNALDGDHGFNLSADSAFAGPTSLQVKIVLKAGETKYIGVPMSDLTYVTASGNLKVKCQLHAAHLGSNLVVLK
ncbi:MAG: hypothetical protein OXI53_05165 [Nitrospira sp.]|nr:hypothetical protein [Nitrospira sp.]MDE0404683.1 hypothetical protein [Nitrospira sp.]MDE0487557.1 hypothetical protein [Nitrospira sp.]